MTRLLVSVVLLLVAGGCQGEAQGEKGYQMPAPTEENREWLWD